MTIERMGGAGSATGVDQVSHDIGDMAFLVALLEVETLDTEIGCRLTEMQRLNAIRKAYNQRISELQELIGRCGDDGKVEVPAAMLRRGEYVWDSTVSSGEGGVVLRPDGRVPFGDGNYRILDGDGTYVLQGEISPVSPTAFEPDSWVPGCGPVACELADEINRQLYRTTDLAEAERIAAERGGQAVATVSRDELVREVEALRDKVGTLSSDAEIGMLGLNRLLSRRNQVLQLASNVMSSQHQTAMGIIANLKV